MDFKYYLFFNKNHIYLHLICARYHVYLLTCSFIFVIQSWDTFSKICVPYII